MRPPVRKAPEPREASQPHSVSHPIKNCVNKVMEFEIWKKIAVPEM